MKLKFSFLLFLFYFISFSQNEIIKIIEPKPTTTEEYNYVTKGYSIQNSSGLDMKKGYILQNVQKMKFGNSSYNLKWLLDENTKELRATMISINEKVFFCIPVNNNELMNKFYTEINRYGGDTINPILFLIGSHYNIISYKYQVEQPKFKD